MPKTDIEIAIIGGGISGLSVAYELHKRNVSYSLFERTGRLGGVIRTDRVSNFTIDGGPDSLLVQKPAAIELCLELGLAEHLISTSHPRTAFILRKGRLHQIPQTSILGIPTQIWPLATTGLLSPRGKLQMALELIRPGKSDKQQDESVASFFYRRFGREAVDYIAEPLLAGIHAGSVDRLSMRALFPRLVEAEQRYGSIIRAFRALRTRRSPDGMFRSLRGGIGELVSTLVKKLPAHCIQTGIHIMTIRGSGPYQLGLATGDTVSAKKVVVAVPAYVAAELLQQTDNDLADLCRGIPYTSTATIALGYPRFAVRHELRGTGFVVPRIEGDVSLMAGSWVSSKWKHRAPQDQVLLRGFVGGARDECALSNTDAGLIESVHRDFSQLLDISTRPLIKRVYRWPRLNPQHEVGHLDRMKAIDARLAQLPGLELIGAGFRGVGIPDCIAHGRATGKRISSMSG